MTDGVVVLGGGFAGFRATLAARRAGDRLAMVMVSPQPVLQVRPRLYEARPEATSVWSVLTTGLGASTSAVRRRVHHGLRPCHHPQR